MNSPSHVIFVIFLREELEWRFLLDRCMLYILISKLVLRSPFGDQNMTSLWLWARIWEWHFFHIFHNFSYILQKMMGKPGKPNEKAYFNQWAGCAATVCWLKYTTDGTLEEKSTTLNEKKNCDKHSIFQSNETCNHWSDSFHFSEKCTMITLEVIEWPLLVLCLIGMNNGIEIGHPIYATLFCNLAMALFFTTANLLSLASGSFKVFSRTCVLCNSLACYFHCTCW